MKFSINEKQEYRAQSRSWPSKKLNVNSIQQGIQETRQHGVSMVLLQSSASEKAFSIAAMHSDRARQFVIRLGWNLRVDQCGWESDEYDDGRSEILLVSSGALHLASCRLRSARHGTMLEDHFSTLFPGVCATVASNRDNFYELSRLVTSPDLCRRQREISLGELAVSLRSVMVSKPSGTRFFAVTFGPALRLMARRGIQFFCLDESRLGNEPIFLVEVRP